jgi:hypothetical protein
MKKAQWIRQKVIDFYVLAPQHLKRRLMGGQETPQGITLSEEEQGARCHVGIAAHQP